MSRAGDKVEGGTNAGWKNPFNGQAMPWQCECVVEVPLPERVEQAREALREGDAAVVDYLRSEPLRKTNLGALVRCPDCGAKRPEQTAGMAMFEAAWPE